MQSLPKNSICLSGYRFVVGKGCIKIRLPKSTVCREGYYIDKAGKCRKEKIVLQRQTVCNEGLKMSKNGRCIKDKDYKPYKYNTKQGQRQTVCLEGYRISKDGKCIKDKNYKITTQAAKGLTVAEALAGASITPVSVVSRMDGLAKPEYFQTPMELKKVYSNAATSIISGDAIDEDDYASRVIAAYKPKRISTITRPVRKTSLFLPKRLTSQLVALNKDAYASKMMAAYNARKTSPVEFF